MRGFLPRFSRIPYTPRKKAGQIYLARGNGSVAFMVRGDDLEAFRKSVEAELETVNKTLSVKAATSQLRTKIARVVKYAQAIEAAARKRIVSISNALSIHLNEVRDLERFLKRPEVTESVFRDACAGVLLDLVLAA